MPKGEFNLAQTNLSRRGQVREAHQLRVSSMSDQANGLFYTFGSDDRPSCAQCTGPMRLSGNRPSTLLGEGYDCHKFTCECGFEIEVDTDRAVKLAAAPITH